MFKIRYLLLVLAAVVRLSAQIEVTSSGDVGIGTTSPASRLHILQTSGGANQLTLDTTFDTGNRFALNPFITEISNGGFEIRDVTNSITRLAIQQSSGNIGIGTTAPAYALHVNGDAGVAARKQFIARYSDSTENYRATFGWSHLQLGNNGPNWIVAGRTAAGGELTFVVNNTNDYAYDAYNGTPAMHIAASGNVGIGTTAPSYKLDVAGQVHATSFVSSTTTYADFVFKPGYKLVSLSETEAAIQRDGHLPGIPSEAQVAKEGIDLASMQVKLLQKVEELTLHQIAQEKRLNEQSARIRQLEEENTGLRAAYTP